MIKFMLSVYSMLTLFIFSFAIESITSVPSTNNFPDKAITYHKSMINELNCIHGNVFTQVIIPLTEKVENKLKNNPIPIVIRLDNKDCPKLIASLFVDKDLGGMYLRPSKLICNKEKKNTTGVIVFESMTEFKTSIILPCNNNICNLPYNTSVYFIEY